MSARDLNLGILVSGRGTNLQALLDAKTHGQLASSLRVVISNKPGVQALERATSAGVPTNVVSHREFASREAFDTRLVAALRDAGVEWVVLAGFMRVLTPVMLRAFEQRIVNIHPALLPAFPGVHAQKQALDYGVKITGCTVHLVDEGVDSGPIILQRALAVRDDDTEDSLSARLLAEEHLALVEALSLLEAGRLRIEASSSTGRTRVFTLPA